jgi:hypothetical protein
MNENRAQELLSRISKRKTDRRNSRECFFVSRTFSRKTLTRLLNRNGLEVRCMENEGVYRRVDTMAYIILCLKQNRPALYSSLKKTGLLNWDLYLNLGDIVFVVAEKR